jgi:hypothetical protein
MRGGDSQSGAYKAFACRVISCKQGVKDGVQTLPEVPGDELERAGQMTCVCMSMYSLLLH